MQLHPDQSAVVLVEFQNQWTRPGVYHSLIARQLRQRATIAHAEELVSAARAAGVLVIHAPLVIDPRDRRGVLARLTRGLVFTIGSAAAEVDERVYQEADLVVDGRTAFDPFVDSTLATVLTDRGIRSVLFAGFATDQCVAKGVRTALSLGYDAFLVTDASATFTGGMQRRTERSLADRAVTVEQVRAALAVVGQDTQRPTVEEL